MYHEHNERMVYPSQKNDNKITHRYLAKALAALYINFQSASQFDSTRIIILIYLYNSCETKIFRSSISNNAINASNLCSVSTVKNRINGICSSKSFETCTSTLLNDHHLPRYHHFNPLKLKNHHHLRLLYVCP